MALKRYVGPYAEVRVVIHGNELGNVVKGGSIVIPDDLAQMATWPADEWEDGESKAPAGDKAGKDNK
jgi:hypothetical protein